MQKLCTAGLTGDERTDTEHRTFAPVDLTAPKVAAGKKRGIKPHLGNVIT